VLCNAVTLLKRLVEREIVVDVLTDQTSAHDPLIGYVPHTLTDSEANELGTEDPDKYIALSYDSMKLHVEPDAPFAIKRVNCI
jgi:urocanate hydratase